jgi:hypothetical protein
MPKLAIPLDLGASLTGWSPYAGDRWENGSTVLDKIQVGSNIQMSSVWVTTEDPSVALIPVIILKRIACNGVIPRPNLIASLTADEAPDIGAHIPAAKMVKIPVGLNGRKFGIVVIVISILGTDQGRRNRRS